MSSFATKKAPIAVFGPNTVRREVQALQGCQLTTCSAAVERVQRFRSNPIGSEQSVRPLPLNLHLGLARIVCQTGTETGNSGRHSAGSQGARCAELASIHQPQPPKQRQPCQKILIHSSSKTLTYEAAQYQQFTIITLARENFDINNHNFITHCFSWIAPMFSLFAKSVQHDYRQYQYHLCDGRR